MHKETKGRWTAALRSGKYQQGRGFLRQVNKKDGSEAFCVFGVLGDVTRPKDHWSEEPKKYPDGSAAFQFSQSSVLLPRRLLDGVGISLKEADTLLEMNDVGASFEIIAGWIEENM